MKFLRNVLLFLCICILLGAVAWKLELVPDPLANRVEELLGIQLQPSTPASQPTVPDLLPPSSSQADPELPEHVEQVTLAMVEGLQNFEEYVELSLLLPEDMGEESNEYLLGLIDKSYSHVRREYPEIFWLGFGTYQVSWIGTDVDHEISLNIELLYSCNPQEAATRESAVAQTIDEMLFDVPEDPYLAARMLHDRLIIHASYDQEAAAASTILGWESAFNIDGVFLDGKAVCEGYAKAYKLLCDRAGIDCVVVYGNTTEETHAWNYVQLNGSWYLVDCTKDDPISDYGDILRWDYFLRGSGGIVDDGQISDLYYEDDADYPTLSESDYGDW